MKIIFAEISVQKEDFGMVVDGDTLVVPTDLKWILEGGNLHSVEQLIATLQSAPDSWAMQLRWNLEEVNGAYQQLVVMLEGKVRADILHPGPPVDYPLGVPISKDD
ncbi:MAG: hypothetical protein ABIO72_05010 [Patescibacteria group bacterium]